MRPATAARRTIDRMASPVAPGPLDGLSDPTTLDGAMAPVTFEGAPVPLTVTMPVAETDTVGSSASAALVMDSARASAVSCRCRALMGVPERILWTHRVTCCCEGSVWRIDSNIAVTC